MKVKQLWADYEQSDFPRISDVAGRAENDFYAARLPPGFA